MHVLCRFGAGLRNFVLDGRYTLAPKLGKVRRTLSPVSNRRPGDALSPSELVDLLADPARLARSLPADTILPTLGALEQVKAALWARWLHLQQPHPTPAPDEDRLLTVEEAATRLGVTKDWLYRNGKDLPFTRRPSPGRLRFSAKALDAHIREQR